MPGRMRIRMIQRPSVASVDGLELIRFEPGKTYEVGTALGCLMLSEGWAEPAAAERAASSREGSAQSSGVDVAADRARRK